MIRFFEKQIVKFKIDNMFIDLNEREYSIYVRLTNHMIGLPEAIERYSSLHCDAKEEYSQLLESYNVKALGLEDRAKDIVKVINFIGSRKNYISQQHTL